MCVSGGKKYSFIGKFVTPVLRFTLLPSCRRYCIFPKSEHLASARNAEFNSLSAANFKPFQEAFCISIVQFQGTLSAVQFLFSYVAYRLSMLLTPAYSFVFVSRDHLGIASPEVKTQNILK